MPELSVAVFATDNDQRAVLQVLVDGTSVARTVCSNETMPLAANDPVIRRTQAFAPDVVLVDIAADGITSALRAVELLHQELPDAAVFAIGPMTQPQLIVSAMRAGVREYIERPTTTTDLLEAFVRLTATRRKPGRENSRGKVFTIVNAKGGSGATTVAVNLALALQSIHHSTALIDLAPLGHCALHLNLKPAFTVSDAITNLHRLDSSLLDSFMARHDGGLQVLAGPADSHAGSSPPLPTLPASLTRWSACFTTSSWMLPPGSTAPLVWSATCRRKFCSSPTPMSLPCGAPEEWPSTSARAAHGTVLHWC